MYKELNNVWSNLNPSGDEKVKDTLFTISKQMENLYDILIDSTFDDEEKIFVLKKRFCEDMDYYFNDEYFCECYTRRWESESSYYHSNFYFEDKDEE
ncbi:hypothetical protein D2A34_05240 [Clostridium chromiireducens]|uniref:Uncharacterized protein n=1 Tax=Clostridium chromiireducens TaxID=225345 RepID=A0A399IUI6_9CLOT|nr:hypothetical protein [Clostridium chromiireducens]RII36788.1 hypothetical protein D2A34_05240 [Clostridium chromiireducens]